MRFFKNIIWQILNILNYYIAKPRMIRGYKSKYGNAKYLDNTRISNTVEIVQPQHLDIGNNVYISHHSILDCSNFLAIGEGCQICAYVSLLTHSSHIAIRLYGKEYTKFNGQHEGYMQGKTAIGKYSFIGPHSVIMPSVTIGKGSIVKAYSYVSAGTYPDFAIIAGNPAKVIGDTRKLDQDLINQYPHLKKLYNEWANNND